MIGIEIPVQGEPKLTVRKISAEDTVDIRQIVLWPTKTRSELILPDDEDGTHFGAFAAHHLVSVISLFDTSDGIRFRKFATLHSSQGQGVGTFLLQHAIEWARSAGGKRIWCDARLSALPFYAKLGFAQEGEVFEKSGVSYIVMSRTL